MEWDSLQFSPQTNHVNYCMKANQPSQVHTPAPNIVTSLPSVLIWHTPCFRTATGNQIPAFVIFVYLRLTLLPNIYSRKKSCFIIFLFLYQPGFVLWKALIKKKTIKTFDLTVIPEFGRICIKCKEKAGLRFRQRSCSWKMLQCKPCLIFSHLSPHQKPFRVSYPSVTHSIIYFTVVNALRFILLCQMDLKTSE